MENIKDEEINFLDLLVVLVRYRKLILGAVLSVSIILGIGYFIYPDKQYKKAIEAQLYEANMELEINPLSKNLIKEYNPQKEFLNTSIILSSLQKAGYTNIRNTDITLGADKQKALNVVRQYLVKSKILFVNTQSEKSRLLKITDSGVNLTFKDKNPEMALSFLEELVRNVNDKFLLDIKPKLNLIVSRYNNLLAIENPDDMVKEVLVNKYMEYRVSSQILKSEFSFFKLVEEPYVFKNQISIGKFENHYKKNAILIILATLFFSIFIVFILHALENIKSNDEAMAKIREVLNKK